MPGTMSGMALALLTLVGLSLPQLLEAESQRSEAHSAASIRQSLLQTGNNLRRGQMKGKTMSKSRLKTVARSKMDPQDPAFFDAFNFQESTYDSTEDPGILRIPGQAASDSTLVGTPRGAAWYDESASLGPKDAVQTHYPALETGDPAFVGRPEWQVATDGHWGQKLTPAAVPGPGDGSGVKNAEWFERSIDQFDTYGRPKAPDASVAQVSDSDGLKQRVVTGNLTCAEPGCAANTTLKLYDPSTEFMQSCTLSFHVHATDFDDDYSGERVMNILANGRSVGSDCFPGVNGCISKLSQEMLYPCVADFPVSTIISSKGELQVAAAIPKEVDECRYSGNLLSAVATATCFVGPITTTTTTSPPNPVRPVMPIAPPPPKVIMTSVRHGVPLKCPTRGCSADAMISLNRTTLTIHKCMLQVFVNQTDYDNNDGSVELLSVTVAGKEALKDAKPGKNPCRSMFDGKPLTAEDKLFHAVKDLDVTDVARKGPILISAKISDQVDECSSQGYLLDADVYILCNVSTVGELLTEEKTYIDEVYDMDKVILGDNKTAAEDAVNAMTGSAVFFAGKASAKATHDDAHNAAKDTEKSSKEDSAHKATRNAAKDTEKSHTKSHSDSSDKL